MIVVDTNVLAYFYLPGEHTPLADALFEHDPEWVAPGLWQSEFRNILVGYLRQGRLTLAQACDVQLEAEALMTGNEYQQESRVVLRLAAQTPCSAYDCEFAALAQQLGVPLVTLDGALLKAFPGTAVSLRDYPGSAISS
jgi:predicted nucleic acid-binding protein